MLNNKIVKVILSALVAFGLWVYVVLVITPDYETTIYNIPVTLDRKDYKDYLKREPGLVLMTEDLPTVDLKLYGNRSDLNKLNSDNITLKVDIDKVKEPGEQSLAFTISYPGDINGNEIQVQSRNPDRIVLRFEKWMRREVPVEVAYSGTPAEGYIANKSTVELEYETIAISGPESAVSKIDKAVVKVNLEGRKESFSEYYAVTLCDEKDKAVDVRLLDDYVEQLKHTMAIQKVVEIPLRLNTVDASGNPSTNAIVTFHQPTIQVAASESALAGMDELVIGTVNISTFSGAQRFVFDIVMPMGWTNISGMEKVTVDVQVKQDQTKTFTLSPAQIQLVNVPENMTAKPVSQSMTVTLRGPQEQLDRIDASALMVQVDVSGETQTGPVILKAVVFIPPAYADVESVSTYSVSVELEEKS